MKLEKLVVSLETFEKMLACLPKEYKGSENFWTTVKTLGLAKNGLQNEEVEVVAHLVIAGLECRPRRHRNKPTIPALQILNVRMSNELLEQE